MNDTTISISIIIVTYNPGEIFFDCLSSLARGIGSLTCEVIVIDNASQDGIVQQAAEKFPDIGFILNTENKGFAGGNNQGLKLAKGRFLLLLNPDVVVDPDSLFVMAHYLEQNPNVGIVGPRTLDSKGVPALTAQASYNALSILWKYLGLNALFPNHVYGQYRRAISDNPAPFEVAWVQGSCLLFRKEVYDKIGGLDEGFFLFSEEPDLCDRALKAGWKTYYIPSATVTHFESTAVSRYPERRIRAYHLSPLYYFRKRKMQGQIWVLKLGFTIELFAKTCIRFIQFLTRKGTWELTLIYPKIIKEIWGY